MLAKAGPKFTVNVDLLLERAYDGANNVRLTRPGVQVSDQSSATDWFVSERSTRELASISAQFRVDVARALSQPVSGQYFKLHGSLEWSAGNGGNLVLGGGKDWSIATNPIFSCYLDQFSKALQAGNQRLLVIGYSFADKHINLEISTAINNHGLKLYIWDPMPPAVLTNALKNGSKSMVNCDTGLAGLGSQHLQTSLCWIDERGNSDKARRFQGHCPGQGPRVDRQTPVCGSRGQTFAGADTLSGKRGDGSSNLRCRLSRQGRNLTNARIITGRFFRFSDRSARDRAPNVVGACPQQLRPEERVRLATSRRPWTRHYDD